VLSRERLTGSRVHGKTLARSGRDEVRASPLYESTLSRCIQAAKGGRSPRSSSPLLLFYGKASSRERSPSPSRNARRAYMVAEHTL